MPESHDPVRDAFAPLREPTVATPSELARARAAASRPARRSRSRWAMGGVVAATVLAAGAAAIVVDGGGTGTFVGEAGARELLRAAADATRNDPAPSGWRWTTTTYVRRDALEGRRCRSEACPVERAVLETTTAVQTWSGPRGEVYSRSDVGTPRAVQNAPLLKAVGALERPPGADAFPGEHVPAVPPGRPDTDLTASRPGTIADPGAVPDEPAALVRWAAKRGREELRAQRRMAARTNARMQSTFAAGTRLSYRLVDLTTAPELSGAQRAAAFEALADRPHVSAIRPPATFGSAGRVAVRIAATPTVAGREELRMMPVPDRVIVFDRSTHRVVAEEAQPTTRNPRASLQFGEGRNRRSLRMVAGGGGETRYGRPVEVDGPGLDDRGRRLLDPAATLDFRRDGTLTPAGRRRLDAAWRASTARGRARRGG